MESKIFINVRCPYHVDLGRMAVVETADSTHAIPLGAQPVLNIMGTGFYVEINSQSLIEVNDPSNIISFLDMTDCGSHYTMCYHPRYKNWPCALDDPGESFNITIPHLVVLDPEGMAKKYHVGPDDIRGRKDIEFLNPNYEGFLARISGALPQIDIAGEAYVVNLQKKELQLVQDCSHTLMMRDFEAGSPLEDDFSYRFLYDTMRREAVPYMGRLADNDSGLVVVELPDLFKLDPVGAARIAGYKDDHYIREHPIEKNLRAVIRNLDGRVLPDGMMETSKSRKLGKKRRRLK
ncbi:hypothetical protein [Sphingobacterium siyangense]|uniref:hypothetical protein n=1 Tax=Sphingobacterium siyangense TaxID=459529 RepID=UPI0019660C20|nr:hypothetical protein [Sphingobacterium siyangense]QRY55575.1 hypothetical protein JVX97_16170 [Sphingobacterium siyangense]